MTHLHHPFLNISPDYKGTDISHLLAWGDALAKAIASKCDLETWLLTGRAATVLCDNTEQAQAELQKVAKIAQMDFKFIPDNEVLASFKSDELALNQSPTFCVLEFGFWAYAIESIEADNKEEITQIQNNIIRAIQLSNASQPVVFVCVMATHQFNHFHTMFKHAGLFDQRFVINKPSLQQLGEHFIQTIGAQHCDSSILQNIVKVGAVIKGTVKDTRVAGIYAMYLIRLAKQQQRLLCYTDIVQVILGSISIGYQPVEINQESINHIATHEAGHALMAMIDSQGQNIPEYISIIKSENYTGIVLESCEYNVNITPYDSYKKVRHGIRVALAGRAAEEIMFGVENVDYETSETDLHTANILSFRLFKMCGLSPDIEQEITTGNLLPNTNLLTLIEHEMTDLDKHHTNKIIAQYLQQQYQWVREQLKHQQPLLSAIANALLEKRVLVQADIVQILQAEKRSFSQLKHRE